MKKVIAVLLVAITILTTVLTLSGCGDKKVHILTRGEWIEEIAKVFQLDTAYSNEPYFDDVKSDDEYFTVVQACAEWDIIEKVGKFEPNERADVNFAMVTAVKSVGLDKIEKSVGGEKLETEKEIIAYFNKHSDVKYISGSMLYMDTASQILQDIGVIYSELKLEQYQNVQFEENVVMLEEDKVAFSADGATATIRSGEYTVGDVLCIEPSVNYPRGKYAKVVSVTGDTIEYEEATLDDIAGEIVVSGTYEPEILGIIPLSDGVTVNSVGGNEVVPQSYSDSDGVTRTIYVSDTSEDTSIIPLADTHNFDDINIDLNKQFSLGDAKITLSGNVKVKDIVATVDLQWFAFVPTKADLKIDSTLVTTASLSGKMSTTFPVAKVPCSLWGIVGLDLILEVKIGAEGEISLEWSVDTSAGVEYEMGRELKYFAEGSNPNVNIEVKAEAYVKPAIKAKLFLGPAAIASVGAYSGVEAHAESVLLGEEKEGCINIKIHVPLYAFVGGESGDGTLLSSWGLTHSWTIWDGSTSPFKKEWHIEEGQVVLECTKTKKQEETETDETYDGEIDADFINQINDLDKYMQLSSNYVILEEGKTDKLNVSQLPTGYTESDLIFSSSDTSVVTVESDGTLRTVSSGSCIISVMTGDGKYQSFCAVRVLASYDVDFTPLAYWEDMRYADTI